MLAAFRFTISWTATPPTLRASQAGMTPQVKELITSADVILALNIRFGEMTTDGYTLFEAPRPQQKLLRA